MQHIVELSIDKILNSAIAESGQVLRGLRSMAQSAEGASLIDSASDDLLLTEDDADAVKIHLNAFVSELYDTIRGYCPEYLVNDTTIGFAIEGAEDCNTAVRITPLIEFYFVYRILAWWYGYRNGDLANNYLLKADDYRQQVLSAIVPKFSTRKLRMF
mgnify:CR=1 FL=1